MANPFVHVELETHQLARAKDFYVKLFDWKLQDLPAPDGEAGYTLIEVGDGTGGGMIASRDANAPARWIAYVGVDDIDASTRRARELGATILQEVMEVGDYGWMSVIADPTGAVLAMWQAKPGA